MPIAHFIIPETIERLPLKKGPYDAEKGDLVTSGFVDFHTADAISNNKVKLEAGQFSTFRVLAMVNLLGNNRKPRRIFGFAITNCLLLNLL